MLAKTEILPDAGRFIEEENSSQVIRRAGEEELGVTSEDECSLDDCPLISMTARDFSFLVGSDVQDFTR